MRFCECYDIPAGRPDPRDSFEEATTRLAHPNCPIHREADGDAGVEYDPDDMREQFGLAYDHSLDEWVDADLIDPDTGYPYDNEDQQ